MVRDNYVGPREVSQRKQSLEKGAGCLQAINRRGFSPGLESILPLVPVPQGPGL